MKAKRLLALGLAGITAFSMAACGGGSGSGESAGSAGGSAAADSGATQFQAAGESAAGEAAPNTTKSDETLVVSMASEPADIWNTATGKQDNQALTIFNCLGDRLVYYDYDTDEVLPWLATEWEWLDDYRLQFTLRDDILMQDGTPLEAEDVLYTVETAVTYSPNNDTGRYFDLEKCEVVDEHTVIIGMNTIAPDFLSMLSESQFGIVCEADVEAAGGIEAAAKNPKIGSGRYRFKEWVNGQYILLERNEDYWDDSYAGYYKEIRFTFTNDAATREMAVESGDAGIGLEIPVNIASTFVESDAVQVQIYSSNQVMHLFFNCRDGVCTDQKVREAIAAAVDVNALCQVATMGYGQVSNGWFMPNGTYYVDMYNGEERTPDIEKAKQLLAEAGYADGLTLKSVCQQQQVPVYTVLQEQLRQAGIDLEIATLDTAQMTTEAKAGNYDIIITGTAIETRKPTLFTFFQKANVESVIGGCKMTTDEIDGLITEMVETADVEQAKEICAQISQILKDNCYSVDLYTENKAVVMRPDMAGFRPMERGLIDCTALYVAQ